MTFESPSPAFVFLDRGDVVGFTFMLTTLAMFAGSIFFFVERSRVSTAWKMPLLIAAIVPLIAGVNYVCLTALWITGPTVPPEFRYLDWFLTVPLLCLQFYLILRASGGKPGIGMVWRLVGGAIWMLSLGYVGEALDPEETILWGAVSTVGYALILFEISLGEARQLSRSGHDPEVQRTFSLLFKFIFIGWAIYPLGYMTMPGNLLYGLSGVINVNVMYNIGDAINKVGFGLAVCNLARSRTPIAAD